MSSPAYSQPCALLAEWEVDRITEHPPVPPGRDLGGEVRQALAGYSLRAGGGILPPRPARDCANRPSPYLQEVPV